MPVIPEGNAQVNLRFSGINLPTGAEVVFGVDPVGTLDPTEVADIVIAAWDVSGLQALQTDETLLNTVLVKFGPVATGASAEVTATLAGSASGAGDSPNTALLLRKITPDGGRAGRGRSYLPGIPETVVSDAGVVDAGFITSADTAAAAFLEQLAVNEAPMILLHGVGSPISLPSVVTSWVADGTVATQRRRLRR